MKGYRLYLQDQPLAFLLMSGGIATWTSFHQGKQEMTMHVGLISGGIHEGHSPLCLRGCSSETEEKQTSAGREQIHFRLIFLRATNREEAALSTGWAAACVEGKCRWRVSPAQKKIKNKSKRAAPVKLPDQPRNNSGCCSHFPAESLEC